jgi:hypothetical protein
MTEGDEAKRKQKTLVIRARHRLIARELQEMYDGFAGEPIPENLLALLRLKYEAPDAQTPRKAY